MEVVVNKNETNLNVKVSGELNTVTSPNFENEVVPQLKGIKNLVLDFKDLEYISSAGLRSILVMLKLMEKQGEMKIINANDAVKNIFAMTGFDSVLNIE